MHEVPTTRRKKRKTVWVEQRDIEKESMDNAGKRERQKKREVSAENQKEE